MCITVLGLRFAHNAERYYLTIQVLSNDNAGKNQSYEKTNSEFVEFVSIPQKLHPFKNPHRLPTEPMGIHHSPHTHTIPLPMGIPIPTEPEVSTLLHVGLPSPIGRFLLFVR